MKGQIKTYSSPPLPSYKSKCKRNWNIHFIHYFITDHTKHTEVAQIGKKACWVLLAGLQCWHCLGKYRTARRKWLNGTVRQRYSQYCLLFLSLDVYHDSLLEPKPKINSFVFKTPKFLMETGNTRSLTWPGSLLSDKRREVMSVSEWSQHLLLEKKERNSSSERGG